MTQTISHRARSAEKRQGFRQKLIIPYRIKSVAEQIRRKIADFQEKDLSDLPRICFVLDGSLSGWLEKFSRENKCLEISYAQIKYLAKFSDSRSQGKFIIAKIDGRLVIFMCGQYHFYEGRTMEEIARPVRALAILGVGDFIFINCAGALNQSYKPGDLMIFKDHVSKLGDSPLRGLNWNGLGLRQPDMSAVYDSRLGSRANLVANQTGINIQLGIYLAAIGPHYETPAEAREFHGIADAVGRSAVPEIIALNHMKKFLLDEKENAREIKIVGLSFISHMAEGSAKHPHSPEAEEQRITIFSDKLQKFVLKLISFI